MPFERWGSLSIDDHVDARALAANVLLYDRLVIPVMTDQPDRDERAHWTARGWNPDLQALTVEKLGQLAVPRPWSKQRRHAFRTRVNELKAERADALTIDDKYMTRVILAQEAVVEKPPGTTVTVIAAYNSASGFERDFPLASAKDHVSAQAYLLSRKLALPAIEAPADLLSAAIELSTDAEFRKRRSDLFDWQTLAFAKQWSPEESVERLRELTDRYNAKVQEASSNVYWKFAFTFFGIGVGFATGGFAGAIASGALSLVQFAKFDSRPTLDADSTEPAAMFHDIETRIGMKFARSEPS